MIDATLSWPTSTKTADEYDVTDEYNITYKYYPTSISPLTSTEWSSQLKLHKVKNLKFRIQNIEKIQVKILCSC